MNGGCGPQLFWLQLEMQNRQALELSSQAPAHWSMQSAEHAHQLDALLQVVVAPLQVM